MEFRVGVIDGIYFRRKRMKKLIALTGILALATAANAQLKFYETFDSYASQSALTNTWNAGTTGGGVTLTKEQSSGLFDWNVKQDTAARASSINIAPVSGADGQELVWSFQFYDSQQTNNMRQFASIRDYTGTALNHLVAIGAYNDTTLTTNRMTMQQATSAELNTYYAARVLTPGLGWMLLNGPGAPTRTTGWHELSAVFGGTTLDFYIDGILSFADVPYSATQGAFTYDRLIVGSALSSAGGVAYYDDVLVMIVPEPSSFVLAGLGVAAVLIFRRRS